MSSTLPIRNYLDFLATCLAEAGVTRFAVSPGSRNAPIVASMLRHGGFELHSFPDERSAAYAALGMAQSQQFPCGVICTSGTAALNFYPAVAESYYQRTPLLVLTADRPKELIDQWDGQTIHQFEVFQSHCKFNAEIPETPTAFEVEQTVYAAVNATLYPSLGPAHINIPLKDPIYEGLETPFHDLQPSKPWLFNHPNPEPISISILQEIMELAKKSAGVDVPKIMVIVGQHRPHPELSLALNQASQYFPVLTDIASHQHAWGLQQWDWAMLNQEPNSALKPDWLISIGTAMISKPLKQWLKKHKPALHNHISATEDWIGDPFETQPISLVHHETDFIHGLCSIFQGDESYLTQWQSWISASQVLASEKLQTNSSSEQPTTNFTTEFTWVKALLKQLNNNTILHVGNSMSARYASWTGSSAAEIWINRGTSGIDGSLSTAVGCAIAHPEKTVVILLGDVSFIYDAHGLWTSSLPQNLKIVVINNGGGRIFDFINGPNKEPQLRPYIQTPQAYDFAHLAAFYGIEHRVIEMANLEVLEPELRISGNVTSEILQMQQQPLEVFNWLQETGCMLIEWR